MSKPKIGRPRGRVTDRNLNIRIPAEELEAAKHAARTWPSFSEFVREALRRML